MARRFRSERRAVDHRSLSGTGAERGWTTDPLAHLPALRTWFDPRALDWMDADRGDDGRGDDGRTALAAFHRESGRGLAASGGTQTR